jgi:regulator of cell morphogenesis and NO signaling
MEQHMAKEERVLFPWLRGRADTAAARCAMQLEHSDTIHWLRAIHATLRRCLAVATGGTQEQVAASRIDHVERWLCEHIHLESNELFPRALEIEPR